MTPKYNAVPKVMPCQCQKMIRMEVEISRLFSMYYISFMDCDCAMLMSVVRYVDRYGI